MTQELDTKTRVQLALCERYMEWYPTLEELIGVLTLTSPDKQFHFYVNDSHSHWAVEVYEAGLEQQDAPLDAFMTDVHISEENSLAIAEGIIKRCQQWLSQRLSPDDVIEEEQPDTILGDGTDTNYIALLMEIGEDEPVAWLEVLNARDGDHALRIAKHYVEKHQQEWPGVDLDVVVERYFLILPHGHTIDGSDPLWAGL